MQGNNVKVGERKKRCEREREMEGRKIESNQIISKIGGKLLNLKKKRKEKIIFKK